MVRDSYVQQTVEEIRRKMEVRGLAPATVTAYLRSVRRFMAHVGKPLGAVKPREIEDFLLELARQGLHPRTRNMILAGLRFAFRGSGSPNPTVGVPNAKAPRKMPEILSGSEVKRLLEATTSPKYRGIFLLLYGAGLRVSEVVGLSARYVEDLLTTLDTDVPKARAILMRVLRPFTLTPDGDSHRISGARNPSAVVGPGVSEKSSSGGVI